MSSILPNYEYDIFISYRHNDNLDGWVTQFVENLEKELRGTLKEPLSIYFDKNPHDGLLQHHEVDDSLKEKLKSLILIPIVSQTYCDPKSFAWEHELIPFIQQAAEDSLGLKTKVSGGNIASRVLPVKIHDIDSADKRLFENVTGSVMRSLDFIYKESGVNRPLRPKDDRDRNQEQIDYRNQVNKVANAIKEIVAGLQHGQVVDLADDQGETTIKPAVVNTPIRKRKRLKIRLPRIPIFNVSLTVIIFMIGFMVLAAIHFSEKPVDTSTIRSIIIPPAGANFLNTFGGNMELSPDGKQLAFVAEDSVGQVLLWVRSLNNLTSQPLRGTEGAIFPFWSPDSKSIGFFADGSLKKIDASGGPVRILCKANSGRGGSWSKDGTIIFCPALNPTELFRINASGGAPEPLTVLDSIQGYVSHRWPHFLPDGEHFLYCARSATATIGDKDGIFLGSLDPTFKPRLIVNSGSSVAYANGRILYTVGQTLMAKPFNIQSFQTMGDAVPIAEDVQFASISAKASFSVSANGLLVFQTKSYSKQSGLSLRQRKTNTSKRITREKSVYNDVRFSPDEKWMVVSLLDAQTGNTDLWLYEFNREIWTRFTFDPNSQRWPIWSPDGRNVVYSSLYENSKFSLLIKAADGSTIEKVLLKDENDNVANHWSADGKFIIYERRDKRSTDLWILPTTGDSKPFPFLQTEFNEYGASFSPDGRWVAYTSNESGRNEVYVRPFPGPGGKSQVSVSGGFYPKWRSDGKEIFYNIRNNTQATEISLGPSSIEVGVTREIFTSPSNNSFDVTRDGQRFLFVDGESENFSPLTLVVNWPEELKKK